jgi:hypothetical protein
MVTSLDCHTAGPGSIPGRTYILSYFNFFFNWRQDISEEIHKKNARPQARMEWYASTYAGYFLTYFPALQWYDASLCFRFWVECEEPAKPVPCIQLKIENRDLHRHCEPGKPPRVTPRAFLDPRRTPRAFLDPLKDPQGICSTPCDSFCLSDLFYYYEKDLRSLNA